MRNRLRKDIPRIANVELTNWIILPSSQHYCCSHLLQQLLRRGGADEAGDVHVDEGGHEELAVEPVHDAAVAGDHVAEVLGKYGLKKL